jgi:hypothetical protein
MHERKRWRTAWATRGGTGFGRSTHKRTQHRCRITHVSFPVPFTSQLSAAIIITISFVVSSEVCGLCSWPFFRTHHLPLKAPNYSWPQQLNATREFLHRYGPKPFHSFILSCTHPGNGFMSCSKEIYWNYLCPSYHVFRNQIKFWRTAGKVLSPRKQKTKRTTYSTAEIGSMNYNDTKMTQFTTRFSTPRALRMHRASLLLLNLRLSTCTISTREDTSPPRYYTFFMGEIYWSTITSRTLVNYFHATLLHTGRHSESWYTVITPAHLVLLILIA